MSMKSPFVRFFTARRNAWIVLCTLGLVHLDLIVPRSLWERTASRIVRPADADFFPGCGASMVTPGSSGNGNETMWYVSLEGTQAQIDCVNQILEDRR